MGSLIYLKNVATLALNAQKCTGCGRCLEVCPHRVFSMNGKKAQITARDACMECGACSRNCEAMAVSVESGVGCAAAVINSLFGREGECCCGPQTDENGVVKKGGSCC